MKEQVCVKCNKTKPETDYYKASHDPSKRRSTCKACWTSLYGGFRPIWYEKNKEGHCRDYAFRRKYGITLDEYEAMLARQKGLCAICQQPPSGKVRVRLCVDHNHTTDMARELLCTSCNTWVGMLETKPEVVEAAKKYLERHNGIAIH
jgi:hypothetical protein